LITLASIVEHPFNPHTHFVPVT